MKTLHFERLTVISHNTREGRVLKFGPAKTVLHGPNGTGKSTLLKTLLWTMGARPAVLDKDWLALKPWALVEFSVGGMAYAALRRGEQFTLFQGETVLCDTRSVTSGFAPYFAQMVEFGLVLPSRKGGEPTIPPPAFYFVPFYIDQDAGWSDVLSSFQGLAQFARWQDPVVEYHSGIRTNRWFEISAGILRHSQELVEPSQQERALSAVLVDVERLLETIPVELDLDDFKEQVELLTQTVSDLHKGQREFRTKLAGAVSKERVLEAQIHILERAAVELGDDLEFASLDLEDEVECPTCQQTYSNDFMARFSIAEDQERCFDLRSELKSDLRKATEERAEIDATLGEMQATLAKVSAALDQRLGELTLRDVARLKGKQELHSVIEARLDQVHSELAELHVKIERLRQEKKTEEEATKKRKKEITAEFLKLTAHHGARMGLTDFGPAGRRQRIRFKIHETGSARPRAILAFTFALYRVALTHGPCVTPPLIVDSPRQQDLDDVNWGRVIRQFAQEFPENAQLILATVGGEEGLANALLHQLDEERNAIVDDQFEEATDAMRPFLLNADA